MKLKQLKLHADGTVAIVDPTADLKLAHQGNVQFSDVTAAAGLSAAYNAADLPAAGTYTLADGTATASALKLPDTAPEATAQKILAWAKARKLYLGIAAALIILYIMYRRAQ